MRHLREIKVCFRYGRFPPNGRPTTGEARFPDSCERLHRLVRSRLLAHETKCLWLCVAAGNGDEDSNLATQNADYHDAPLRNLAATTCIFST